MALSCFIEGRGSANEHRMQCTTEHILMTCCKTKKERKKKRRTKWEGGWGGGGEKERGALDTLGHQVC